MTLSIQTWGIPKNGRVHTQASLTEEMCPHLMREDQCILHTGNKQTINWLSFPQIDASIFNVDQELG